MRATTRAARWVTTLAIRMAGTTATTRVTTRDWTTPVPDFTTPALFAEAGDAGVIAARLLELHCDKAQRLHDQTVRNLRAAGIRAEVARDAARAFLPAAMN